MNPEIQCFKCSSKFIIKHGKAYSDRKGSWRQKYICRDCGYKFLGRVKYINEPMPFVYKPKTIPSQDWVAYTKAQNCEKLMLMDLADELLSLVDLKQEKKVGRKTKNIKEIIFCLVLKTYSGLSSRRLVSDLEISMRQGYLSSVPHFTTFMNYLESSQITPLLQELIKLSSLPLKFKESSFSIDSSGFSTSKFGRWFDYKFDVEKERRTYYKAHITIGVKSNIVTSVEVTDQFGADSPQLIPLLKKTSIHFNVKELSADRAYSSRANLEAVIEAGGIPYIPFKSNITGKALGSNVWKTMYRYFKGYPQDFFEAYHKRSNVETAFHMLKAKFKDNLMTKKEEANVNELLLKILCHNLCVLIMEYHENQLNIQLSTQTQKIKIPQK